LHQRDGVGPRRNAPWSKRTCERHQAGQDDLDNEEAEAEAIRLAEAEWAEPAASYADLVRSGIIRHQEAIDVEHEGYERALSSLRKYGP
jgi:hypothetical protein